MCLYIYILIFFCCTRFKMGKLYEQLLNNCHFWFCYFQRAVKNGPLRIDYLVFPVLWKQTGNKWRRWANSEIRTWYCFFLRFWTKLTPKKKSAVFCHFQPRKWKNAVGISFGKSNMVPRLASSLDACVGDNVELVSIFRKWFQDGLTISFDPWGRTVHQLPWDRS